MVNTQWLAAFGSECWYCGKTLTPDITTVDHRTPVCRGGSDEAVNLVPACGRCNCAKGSKTEAEYFAEKPVFAQRLRFQPLFTSYGGEADFPTDIPPIYDVPDLDVNPVDRPRAVGSLRDESEATSWAWRNPA